MAFLLRNLANRVAARQTSHFNRWAAERSRAQGGLIHGLDADILHGIGSMLREHFMNNTYRLNRERSLFKSVQQVKRGETAGMKPQELREAARNADRFGGVHAATIKATVDTELAAASHSYAMAQKRLAIAEERTRTQNARAGAEHQRAGAEFQRAGAQFQREQAETARATAETAKTAQQHARATAETARATAETAKTGQQSARATAETARAAAETAKTAQQNARATAETARATAETAKTGQQSARATAETARATAETAKTAQQHARATAETARATAETAKTGTQTAREKAEQARVTAETAREGAQHARETAETARATAETARGGAQTAREKAEQARTTAETAREGAQTAREKAEQARTTAETAREGAQQAREKAEQARAVGEASRAAGKASEAAAAPHEAAAAASRATAAQANTETQRERTATEERRKETVTERGTQARATDDTKTANKKAVERHRTKHRKDLASHVATESRATTAYAGQVWGEHIARKQAGSMDILSHAADLAAGGLHEKHDLKVRMAEIRALPPEQRAQALHDLAAATRKIQSSKHNTAHTPSPVQVQQAAATLHNAQGQVAAPTTPHAQAAQHAAAGTPGTPEHRAAEKARLARETIAYAGQVWGAHGAKQHEMAKDLADKYARGWSNLAGEKHEHALGEIANKGTETRKTIDQRAGQARVTLKRKHKQAMERDAERVRAENEALPGRIQLEHERRRKAEAVAEQGPHKVQLAIHRKEQARTGEENRTLRTRARAQGKVARVAEVERTKRATAQAAARVAGAVSPPNWTGRTANGTRYLIKNGKRVYEKKKKRRGR